MKGRYAGTEDEIRKSERVISSTEEHLNGELITFSNNTLNYFHKKAGLWFKYKSLPIFDTKGFK